MAAFHGCARAKATSLACFLNSAFFLALTRSPLPSTSHLPFLPEMEKKGWRRDTEQQRVSLQSGRGEGSVRVGLAKRTFFDRHVRCTVRRAPCPSTACNSLQPYILGELFPHIHCTAPSLSLLPSSSSLLPSSFSRLPPPFARLPPPFPPLPSTTFRCDMRFHPHTPTPRCPSLAVQVRD